MATIEYFIFHNETNTPFEGSSFLVDTHTNPDSISIEITGTATSLVIQFEALIVSGGNWKAVAGVKLDDFFMSSNTTKLNEMWLFDVCAFSQFRVNILDVSGGYINVKGKINKFY